MGTDNQATPITAKYIRPMKIPNPATIISQQDRGFQSAHYLGSIQRISGHTGKISI